MSRYINLYNNVSLKTIPLSINIDSQNVKTQINSVTTPQGEISVKHYLSKNDSYISVEKGQDNIILPFMSTEKIVYDTKLNVLYSKQPNSNKVDCIPMNSKNCTTTNEQYKEIKDKSNNIINKTNLYYQKTGSLLSWSMSLMALSSILCIAKSVQLAALNISLAITSIAFVSTSICTGLLRKTHFKRAFANHNSHKQLNPNYDHSMISSETLDKLIEMDYLEELKNQEQDAQTQLQNELEKSLSENKKVSKTTAKTKTADKDKKDTSVKESTNPEQQDTPTETQSSNQ